jgi:hypothetical protein
VLGTVTALVLALVFGGAWFAQWRGLFGSGSSPSSAPSVDAALFVAAPEDLGSVNPQATWQIATTTSTIDATTPQAKCLPSTAEDAQQPQDTLVRTFSSDGATAGAVLFQVNRYDTAETAQTAYAALLSELANCDRTTVWAVRGLAIQGLADEAAGQVFEVQDATNEFHTIALARTGTRVSIIDATQAQSAVSGDAVVGVLSAVGKRQCTDGGTCPTTPATTEIAPLDDHSGGLARDGRPAPDQPRVGLADLDAERPRGPPSWPAAVPEPGHDGAGVPHGLALGRGEAGDVADDRLGDVARM